VLVLFGAGGDLAARKIAPAIYNLAADGLLNRQFAVLGLGRREWSDDTFRGQMADAIKKHSRSGFDQQAWDAMAGSWHFQIADADKPEDYKAIAARLDELDRLHGTQSNRMFYLATPPDKFGPIIRNVGSAGLGRPAAKGAFVRVVVEKPFGRDLHSARRLNELLLETFSEDQVYRIDHYLGKEVVQNLLILRFGNAIFEPLLSRQYVDHVQITAGETDGVEGRGAYYDTAGALRDMIQNHLLQVLALVAMEPPASLTPDAIRAEKGKLLRAIRTLTPEDVARQTARGQYGAGPQSTAAPGAAAAPGYCQEKSVAPDSQTETFAAVKLFVDNWRWAGVPFYLRTGKRLAQKISQVVVVFKREPLDLLGDLCCDARLPNRMVIRISPDEGLGLHFDAKRPGAQSQVGRSQVVVRPVKMDFRYESSFEWASPEAYESLLLDVCMGEPTLFIRTDEVEASWRFVDSIRTVWDHSNLPAMEQYATQSWGPPRAQALFDDPYVHWFPE
jgi:glucose-6-phosphate 1-dehydrogenase